MFQILRSHRCNNFFNGLYSFRYLSNVWFLICNILYIFFLFGYTPMNWHMLYSFKYLSNLWFFICHMLHFFFIWKGLLNASTILQVAVKLFYFLATISRLYRNCRSSLVSFVVSTKNHSCNFSPVGKGRHIFIRYLWLRIGADLCILTLTLPFCENFYFQISIFPGRISLRQRKYPIFFSFCGKFFGIEKARLISPFKT